MNKNFDDARALWRSQLAGGALEVGDRHDVAAARGARDFDGCVALGKALSKQWRYLEAADAYSMALDLRPDDPAALRLRAGSYLSTLQCGKAQADLVRCLALGADELDVTYRLGLCAYFSHDYAGAMAQLEACMPLCDDEMGIAVIYWHTLCAYRLHADHALLRRYHAGMQVGHHTAYELAMSVCAGANGVDAALTALDDQPEDLEYVIALYGICLFLQHTGEKARAEAQMRRLLARDGFWPCYAYLAAWGDQAM